MFAPITASYTLDAQTSDYAVSAGYSLNITTIPTGAFVLVASGALSDETASYTMTASYYEPIILNAGTF
jgi:hypothetical protein